MDQKLRSALIARLEAEENPIVPIADFFNGNTDPASIGCNLLEPPGIDVFRRILVGLEKREDVEAVYAQIAEIDPGPKYWPFTDTVWVVGSMSQEELAAILLPLGPDDVSPGDLMGAPPEFLWQHSNKVLGAWWD